MTPVEPKRARAGRRAGAPHLTTWVAAPKSAACRGRQWHLRPTSVRSGSSSSGFSEALPAAVAGTRRPGAVTCRRRGPHPSARQSKTEVKLSTTLPLTAPPPAAPSTRRRRRRSTSPGGPTRGRRRGAPRRGTARTGRLGSRTRRLKSQRSVQEGSAVARHQPSVRAEQGAATLLAVAVGSPSSSARSFAI